MRGCSCMALCGLILASCSSAVLCERERECVCECVKKSRDARMLFYGTLRAHFGVLQSCCVVCCVCVRECVSVCV